MSAAHDDLDAVVPGSTLTYRDLRAVQDELILRQRQQEATAYVRQRGRQQSERTKAKISARLATYRRNQALAADWVHPVRQARLDKGLTQSGLAVAALVDQTVIQRLESGVATTPSRLTLARLSRCLGVAADSLS